MSESYTPPKTTKIQYLVYKTIICETSNIHVFAGFFSVISESRSSCHYTSKSTYIWFLKHEKKALSFIYKKYTNIVLGAHCCIYLVAYVNQLKVGPEFSYMWSLNADWSCNLCKQNHVTDKNLNQTQWEMWS